jgi:hypothetical protein
MGSRSEHPWPPAPPPPSPPPTQWLTPEQISMLATLLGCAFVLCFLAIYFYVVKRAAPDKGTPRSTSSRAMRNSASQAS